MKTARTAFQDDVSQEPQIEGNIDSYQFEFLYDKLQEALFSKEELQVLRQVFQLTVYAMGSTSHSKINLHIKLYSKLENTENHLQ